MTSEEIEFTEAPTALYRLFDLEGTLLYVGITDALKNRMAQHAGEKAWWPAVVKKTVTWYGSRAEAEAAESAAIQDEAPIYNVAQATPGVLVRRVENSHAECGGIPWKFTGEPQIVWVIKCPFCRREHAHDATSGPATAPCRRGGEYVIKPLKYSPYVAGTEVNSAGEHLARMLGA